MNRQLPMLALLLTVGFLLGSCSGTSPEVADYQSHDLHFESSGNSLAATLNVPRRTIEAQTMPLLIFVHGDGDMTADAYGYNSLIWRHLARRGIATLAWDKPGVGNSNGNWLHQSMDDRATELIDVIEQLPSNFAGERFSSIGLLGFSQAGWVLPKVAARSDYPDFLIMVSGAINWKRQSNYLTRRRLEEEGLDEAAIDAAIAQNARDLEFLDSNRNYDDYLQYERDKCENGIIVGCEPMSRDRYRFVQLNVNADASEALTQVDRPFLALFGDHDLNVDVNESRETYQQLIPVTPQSPLRMKTYADATHSLLKVDYFDIQVPDLDYIVTLLSMGEVAFVDGVLEDIADFALAH